MLLSNRKLITQHDLVHYYCFSMSEAYPYLPNRSSYIDWMNKGFNKYHHFLTNVLCKRFKYLGKARLANDHREKFDYIPNAKAHICNQRILFFEFNGEEFYYVPSSKTIWCNENVATSIMAQVYLALKPYVKESPKLSPRSKIDELRERVAGHYINADIQQQLLEYLSQYVTTYSVAEDMGINMNLSLILTGKPGDGKTYCSEDILQFIASMLSVNFVREEIMAFEKAAKLVPNLVALIDDMNIVHFQRNGQFGDICSNILQEMDRPKTNRLFMLTTNEQIVQENIDHAFFRPGRVQAIINFDRPNQQVKQRFFRDMVNKLNDHNLSLDKNFIAGIELFALDTELPLASLFKIRNTIIRDMLVNQKLRSVRSYIEESKPITIPHGEHYDHSVPS